MIARRLAGVLALAACTCAPAARTANPPPATAANPAGAVDVRALADELVSGMFERDPVGATAMGEHRFDDRWPDLSPAARAEQERWADAMAARLEIDRTALSPDERVDLDILVDQVRGMQLGAAVEKPWTTNPLAYAGTIGSGIDDLCARDFAPVDQRAASLAARLEGLPALVDEAVVNLADPAVIKAPHARVAVDQLAGVEVLVEKEVPARMAGASEALRARIGAATPAALAAVRRLRAHVKALEPQARGEWRLGRQAFDEKLRITLQTDLSADEVHAAAREEHVRVRARMAELARELYPALFGAAALQRLEGGGGADLEQRIVRDVLAELGTDHATPEGLRDAADETIARLSAFVTEHALVPLDPAEVLEVIWTPPHERGVAIAGLDAPAPLDAAKPGLPSFYVVQPVPEDWSAARRESFLREYNRFMMEILSIHEAVPGHFVQLYYAKRDPSPVRKLFSNGPFVEGWAVYAERVMVEAGYAGAGPAGTRPRRTAKGRWAVSTDAALRAKAIALHGQKFFLRTITNAILDHEIHAGTMTEEQAVALMVDGAFQEEGEARAKWVRAQLSSTQLSTYFVGATAWFRLRAQAEERARARGEAFSVAEFHREALSHGAPPVHRLPELMGWDRPR